jgi:hypothetical protein
MAMLTHALSELSQVSSKIIALAAPTRQHSGKTSHFSHDEIHHNERNPQNMQKLI